MQPTEIPCYGDSGALAAPARHRDFESSSCSRCGVRLSACPRIEFTTTTLTSPGRIKFDPASNDGTDGTRTAGHWKASGRTVCRRDHRFAVRSSARRAGAPRSHLDASSLRNAVLIGAVPGEIAYASMRAMRHGLASVAFEPVRAVPDDSLHSDKRVARIIALAVTAPQSGNTTSSGRRQLEARRAWCDAILDSGRKRFRTTSGGPRSGTSSGTGCPGRWRWRWWDRRQKRSTRMLEP